MTSLVSNSVVQPEVTTQSDLNKPVLRHGNQGELVKELQELLANWGLFLGNDNPVTGIFDAETEAAVKTFQYRMFLVEDGIVGSLTWRALYSGDLNMPALKRGDRGQAVTTLQQVLRETGDYLGEIDGIFGVQTEAAVRAFQKATNLVVDGIVGSKTWQLLSLFRR
jgi:peptidoglycan hydrolase-like protein with peptidoglycan-binding domain